MSVKQQKAEPQGQSQVTQSVKLSKSLPHTPDRLHAARRIPVRGRKHVMSVSLVMAWLS